jgi:hypothetical protein
MANCGGKKNAIVRGSASVPSLGRNLYIMHKGCLGNHKTFFARFAATIQLATTFCFFIIVKCLNLLNTRIQIVICPRELYGEEIQGSVLIFTLGMLVVTNGIGSNEERKSKS